METRKKSNLSTKNKTSKSNNTKKITKKKSTNKPSVNKSNSTKQVNKTTTKQPIKKEKKVIKKQDLKEEVKFIEPKKEEIKVESNKKEIKNKRDIFLIFPIAVLSLILILTINVMYPKIKEKSELKKLDKEISKVIDNNYSLENAKKELEKDITTKNRIDLEHNLENYLLETIKIKEIFNEIKKDENINFSLNVKKTNEKNILEYYEENFKKLNDIKEELKTLKKEENEKIESFSEYKTDYKNQVKKINLLIDEKEIDKLINYLNMTRPLVKYLNDNKTLYDIGEDKIIWKKRKQKEEYDKLLESVEINEKIIESVLVEDKKGPEITASDITITKGTSLTLNDKIKCIDDVDDVVNCSISGTYNSSKAGEYTITITSKDKSNNESSKKIKVIVKERQAQTTTVTSSPKIVNSNKPYYIEVIRNQNVVVVYGKDSENKYSKIVKVFVASVGKNGKTPTGTFKTTKGYAWGALIKGVYGQYTTRITGSYLFHSVPYYTKNKGDLEWQEYNKLGTAASAGCVRLTVRDAKWIYDNVASGTIVKIYDGSLPNGVSKPSATKIPSSSSNKGWDPTDPDPNNPWKK